MLKKFFSPRLASFAVLVFFAAAAGGCSLFGGGVQTGETVYRPGASAKSKSPEAEKDFDLARVLWRNSDVCSDPDKAIEYLDRAIKIDPEYADAYMRRGMARSDRHDWDKAFDDLTVAIRLRPSPEAYAFRGLVSMRGGNAMGARMDYDRSLEMQSSQHRAWNYRGALNILEGKKEEACKDFKKGCSNGDCTGLESAKREGYCE